MASSIEQQPEGLRQRSLYVPPMGQNMGPVPILNRDYDAEENPDCQRSGILDAIGSGLKYFFGGVSLSAWPDLTEDPNEYAYEDIGIWEDVRAVGPYSTTGTEFQKPRPDSPYPVVRFDSPETSPQTLRYDVTHNLDRENEMEMGDVLTPAAAPARDAEFRTAERLEEARVKDDQGPVITHTKPTRKQILMSLNTTDKCAAGFKRLDEDKDGQKTLKELNFEGAQPLVLKEYIKYLKANEGSFRNLRTMKCRGHKLDPAETATLLGLLANRKRDNGDNELYLDLTPGYGNHHYILVAVAARFTERFDNLVITFSGLKLPDGFRNLILKGNLQILESEFYKNDSSEAQVNIIKDIIRLREVTITYANTDGHGKKLILK